MSKNKEKVDDKVILADNILSALIEYARIADGFNDDCELYPRTHGDPGVELSYRGKDYKIVVHEDGYYDD